MTMVRMCCTSCEKSLMLVCQLGLPRHCSPDGGKGKAKNADEGKGWMLATTATLLPFESVLNRSHWPIAPQAGKWQTGAGQYLAEEQPKSAFNFEIKMSGLDLVISRELANNINQSRPSCLYFNKGGGHHPSGQALAETQHTQARRNHWPIAPLNSLTA